MIFVIQLKIFFNYLLNGLETSTNNISSKIESIIREVKSMNLFWNNEKKKMEIQFKRKTNN